MSINYTTLLTGALGFTIAMAWNDAISKTIRSIYPPTSEGADARAMLIYALVITILVIIIVVVVNHTHKVVHRALGFSPAVDTSQTANPIIKLWTPPSPQ